MDSALRSRHLSGFSKSCPPALLSEADTLGTPCDMLYAVIVNQGQAPQILRHFDSAQLQRARFMAFRVLRVWSAELQL